MNIFVTDTNPSQAAYNLDNKRVVKMVLESSQMLSTAIYVATMDDIQPCKPTHINHPCNIWARQSKGNYLWLLDHFEALCFEYSRRYPGNNPYVVKQHKHELHLNYYRDMSKHFTGDITPFANCAAHNGLGISFKHNTDTVQAYRDYLMVRWQNDRRLPSWGFRGKPNWYK